MDAAVDVVDVVVVFVEKVEVLMAVLNPRVGLDRGLDGVAVELDRVTEDEVEEAIDTVDPERPPLLWLPIIAPAPT